MGVLSSTIAPTSSIAVGNTQLGNAARGESAANAQTTQNIVSSSPAAVVTLSSDSKSRGASSGDQRVVDGSFEKQEADSKTKKDGSGVGAKSGTLVNIEA